MATRTLSPVERKALMIRHNAAVALLRADPELSPDEALLRVVCPPPELRRVSEETARAALPPDECGRCSSPLDADFNCSFCGATTVGKAA